MGQRLRHLLDVVFDPRCEVCEGRLPLGHPHCLCPRCFAAIVPPPAPLCARCGVPLGSATEECPDCRQQAPAFEVARAAGLYLPRATGLNPLATAVRRLKYHGRRVVASTLGTLLATRFPFADDALLVPVPLHPSRLRARGFNQAALLATELARRRRGAVDVWVLHRLREGPRQTTLGAAERAANLSRCFAVRNAAGVDGRHVVLIDDVITTGATANACARVLLAAGARRVDVWAAGRAPLPDDPHLNGSPAGS